ncbi:hypothetical protein [Glaciecola sp. KUL10]|uniref:hypothetical protein n=1 Tax=Glaciecola sp. (strain KUL10) TaxID=2161813 RepID=UPI000D7851B7|nr:hypothetical protein [Glaciecola sp. KUL10]GBL06338.1 hypothetical protein KUL10_36820 [Glaciecola sp. KUL10]
MIELIVISVFIYVIYFWVIPRINSDELWLSNKIGYVKFQNFHLTLGRLSYFDSSKNHEDKFGFHLSTTKPWARGPLEIMLTSSISRAELEKAILDIDSEQCTISFKKAQFFFSGEKLVKAKIKKNFFFTTINYRDANVKDTFRNALLQLKAESA